MVAKERVESAKKLLREGFLRGTAWALGATFGFAIIIAVLTYLLSLLGGLPLIGDWFASVIEATNSALEARKALPR